MAIAFADISIGNCVCTKFNWQLRLRKFQSAIAFADISIGNCVCENFNRQLRLRIFQLAIAFALADIPVYFALVLIIYRNLFMFL